MAHVSLVLPDGRTLLDDVSFRIGDGITAALVGPNGAGKTTLLRLVAGDLQPQSGTVTATARPFHLGARSHVWHIEIRDESERLVCVSRLTMAIVERR